MKLLQGIKNFFVREQSVSDPDGWVQVGSRSDSGEVVSESSALALSTVWACVNLLAGTQASLPFEVRRAKDGVSETLSDHPLHRVIHDSPNADQTSLDFWEFSSADIELNGDSISRKVKSGDRLIGLIPVRSDIVQRRRLSDGRIGYQWSEDGKRYDLTEEDVLHIRGFGGAPLGGMSTLQFARNEFGLARAINRSASSVFKNGMQPSGALTFDKFLTQEQRDIAKTELVEEFIGAKNAGKPLILEGSTKWQSLSINPEDAQMLEARRFSVEEICRFFGVPPHLVGHTENNTSWGSGIEQQTLSFVIYTLRRRLKRIEKAVEKQLLSSVDRSKGITVKFNLEGLLRGDSKGRAEFYQTMSNMGAMTINEVRKLEGLPPVTGGDVPRMQMQNVPIMEAGST